MRAVRFGDVRLVVPPGVYRPRSDTALLAARLGPVQGASVLELCAGSGALALTCARQGAATTVAVDRCRRAALTIRANAWLNRVRVDVRHGDLLDALAPHERFDVVIANPPYLPVAPGSTGTDHRWDAGVDGRAVLDRIVDGVARHLRPGGRLVLVQSGLADPARTCERLQASGLEPRERHVHRGAYGPIVAARLAALARAGRCEGDDRVETLEVITAVAA